MDARRYVILNSYNFFFMVYYKMIFFLGLIIYFAYGIRNSKERKVTNIILEYEPEDKDVNKIN